MIKGFKSKADLISGIAIVALATILAGIALPASAKDDKSWLDGKVAAIGHVAGSRGPQVPTATVVVYDPGNSNPLARKQVWVITVDAYLTKTTISLSVGDSFKGYRTGETTQSYGCLTIRYLDKKGREKGECHLIVQALGAEDVP